MSGYYHLSEEDKERIEKAVNHPGRTEAHVKVEHGELSVIMVEKKKIS